jgi:DNA-binding GntR family transcriptional regulator
MRACGVAIDLEGLVAADVEFHRSICDASGSRRLLQAWETLNPARWTLVSGLRATDLSLEQIAERHWPILAALQSRKPDNAENIIRSHILDLGERVLAGVLESGCTMAAGESAATLHRTAPISRQPGPTGQWEMAVLAGT